jgi:amino acid adenylation domain-containing protein/FkbM family methyltransferase
VSAIKPRSRGVPTTLSFAQEPIWLLDQLDPSGSAYLISSALRLFGPVSIPALQTALADLVLRHESLHTRFDVVDGLPVQVVEDPSRVRLVVESPGEGLAVADRETAARRRMAALASAGFQLSKEIPFRVVLLRISDTDHLLALFTHHIVMDGWSMGICWRELSALYNSRRAGAVGSLPPVTLQPGDYAAWERDHWQGELLDERLEFWRDQLAGPLPVLELPIPRPTQAQASPGVGIHRFELPWDLFQQFKALCQRERASAFMGLLALYQFLLHRCSGAEDLLVGYGNAGRTHPEVEGMVGMFVNTTVIRTDLGGGPTFLELLRRVRASVLDAFEQGDLPFEILVRELAPQRHRARNPFFQVGFAYAADDGQAPRFDGLQASPSPTDPQGAKFDLMLGFHETPTRIEGVLEHDRNRYEGWAIAGLAAVYEELMRGVVGDGGRGEVKGYALVGGVEREEVLGWAEEGCVNGERVWGCGGTVWEGFVTAAARWPEREAVVGEGRRVGYGELKGWSVGIGRRLRKLGVGRESVVMVYGERSVEWVAGMLGVWAAGAGYVSVEGKVPRERVEYVARDSGARVVVTSGKWAEGVKGVGMEVVCVEEVKAEEGEETGPGPGDLAYVMYTSGSTGRPKGVEVEQKQLSAYVSGVMERVGLEEGMKYGMVSTVGADLGHTVLYPSLVSGGTLHVVSEEVATNGSMFAEYVEREGLEVVKVVPSHLEALRSIERPERVLPRRKLILGGESSGKGWVRGLMEEKAGMEVWSHYGPTETTVGAVAGRVELDEVKEGEGNVALGRPLRQARVYVLGPSQELMPAGVCGEICIGGEGVARGYRNLEEGTRERFLKDPYCAEAGGRLYRTGDVGRFLRDGRVEYVGRRDRQVKVRGYRVELGEVESVLKEHEGLREAVVEVKGGELVGYVVPRDERAAALSGWRQWEVGEGLRVAHVNRNETEYIYREIFEQQAYGRHGVRVREGGVVLDVGANIGLFSVWVNLTVKGARVYAFEPNPVVYEALKRNARAYGGGRTEAINEGMSSEAGEKELTFYEGFSLLSGFYAEEGVEREVVKRYVKNQQKGTGRSEEELEREAEELVGGRFEARRMKVKVGTLGGFMRQRGMGEVELLKVNVEKSEWDVLQGLGREEWRRIRQVVVEVDVKGNVERIVKLLEGEGYEVMVEQDALLERTELCYVYGIRPGEHGRLERGETPRREVRVERVRLPGAEELAGYVGGRLPEHMVPRRYVYLERVPLTGNGKVDRGALPEPEAAGQTGVVKERVGPRNEQERVIAGIWSEVLGVPEVGVKDDFFELGGHSLRATQVVSRISEALGVRVPVRRLFDAPTVEGLALAVSELLERKSRRRP